MGQIDMKRIIYILIAAALYSAGLLTGMQCNSSKSLRVDETKNKAIESFSNWGAVNRLIEKNKISEALEMACFLQEGLKTSTVAQNKCTILINFRINSHNKEETRKQLTDCKKANLSIEQCLSILR